MSKNQPSSSVPREVTAALARIDFFAGVDDQSIRQIAERVHVRRFDTGQSVCRYNDESRDVFMILEGIARATIFSPNGREVAFRDLRAGDSFGELAAIDPQPRSANVITQCPSLVALVSAADFLDIMRRNPRVTENIMRKLARWVRSLSERVYEFNAPVAVRICSEMLRQARANMISENIARFRPAPKHAEIAARVNTHREAVTRTFGELKKAGIIKRGRGELLVTDVEGLARYQRELEADEP